MNLSEVILYFFLYSFLGWVYESALVSIREKKWSNRGFLIGPICPIYGVGSVLCILICSDINIWITFLLCMLGSAILEYTTAYTLERLFHATWWDYSNMPLNLHGYICLPVSIAFGIAGVVISHFIHPFIAIPVELIPDTFQEIIAMLLIAICSSDLTITVSSLSDFTTKMKQIETKINNAIADKYNEIENTVSNKLSNAHKLSIETIKESIIEQELKRGNMKLNIFQFHAVKTIKKFKSEKSDEGAHAENRLKIKEMMVNFAEKAKDRTKQAKKKAKEAAKQANEKMKK